MVELDGLAGIGGGTSGMEAAGGGNGGGCRGMFCIRFGGNGCWYRFDLLVSSSNRRLDSCNRVAVFIADISACIVRDRGRELLVLILCTSLLLYLVKVSVENRLIPLSVLIDGHLLFSFLEGGGGGPIIFNVCPSGIDFECRIDDCALIDPVPKPTTSWRLILLRLGQGDIVPGDRLGVRSENTLDTC